MTALLDELMEHPLTEDDLDSVGRALDGTGIHYELDNGRLVLMSPMKGWHADAARRLCNVLVAQGRPALQEQGVRLARRRVRFPDIAAFRQWPDPDAGRHDPSDFTLVVEVISDGSEHDDRVTKPDLYAAAEIPEYWIVDRHPDDRRDAVIEFFKLGQGARYERIGEAVLTELEAKYGTK
ncbi:Uma2 family endonuclease [Natronosporangium hydrolyticum]|uniref:Uma2 family endonuclease n=1 Tax=Natronosporangium hydrolyticum TaxID=2811111 RepID=A0A895YDH4_9ACTN|nr:Uma2 family endonuclease [Natronosporangium hydrolyticum]QSB15601.1 Uma2 family endonuclease [Natronosporangium hydrolyticum]